MCWVIPPLSDFTTFDLRIRSSSEVLPWSTWPRMVITGGRSTRSASSSTICSTSTSSSAAVTISIFRSNFFAIPST